MLVRWGAQAYVHAGASVTGRRHNSSAERPQGSRAQLDEGRQDQPEMKAVALACSIPLCSTNKTQQLTNPLGVVTRFPSWSAHGVFSLVLQHSSQHVRSRRVLPLAQAVGDLVPEQR